MSEDEREERKRVRIQEVREAERVNERVMRNAVVCRARLGEFVTASGGYLRRGCIPRSNPFFR